MTGDTTPAPGESGSPFVPPAVPPVDATPFTGPTPGTAAAGSTVPVDESGFEPGEDVHAVLYSDPVVLGTLTADATGAVQGTVAIPADTSAGGHTLVLFGNQLRRSLALTVTAAQTQPQTGAVPAPSQARPQTLPRTGAAMLMVEGLFGVGLVAGGLALVQTSRRRWGEVQV